MAGFSTRSTLHRRISTFVEWIATEPATEDAIRRQAEEVRSRLTGKASSDGLTVRSTPNGGSFAKRTGLRRHLHGDAEVEGQDVDLPFVISPKSKDDEDVDRLLDRFDSYAKASYADTPRERTKCSVKLNFVASRLSFDLVPMLATDVDDEQILVRDDGERRRTSVQKNIEFVAARTRSSNEIAGRVKFNECVRLTKWWREFRLATADTLTDVPSFVVELLAAKAYDSLSVKSTYAETLAAWFAFLADLVAKRAPVTFTDFTRPPPPSPGVWSVLDPVNPKNNAVGKWAGYQIDELADWFAAGRDAWGRTLAADLRSDDAASLAALVDVFGNPIRHHAGDK
jgi:hypothetical protein